MGMDWGSVGAGVAGGLDKFLDTLSYQQKYQQDERKMESDARVKELMAEIRVMTAMMNNDTRRAIAGENNATRTTIAGANNDTRVTVAGMNNDTRTTVAAGNNATTARGQDLNYDLGLRRNETTRRGQDFGFTLGTARNETTRRGQDITSSTTRRGQDIGRELGLITEGGRNTRAADANTLRVAEGDKNREVDRERIRNRSNPFSGVTFGGDDPLRELTDGTGRPTAEPIEVIEPPTDDRPLPSSPEKSGDQLERLGSQIDSLMNQIKTAPTAAQRNALRRQLKPVLEAYQKAGGK
jgi:hypothetical protein